MLGIAAGSVAEVSQEACDDALGHPPDDRVFQSIGRELAALTADVQSHRVVGVRMQQEVDRDPLRGGHFGVEREPGPVTQREHMGPDGDRGQDGIPGHDVVEGTDEMPTLERETNLLRGLPHGRREEVRLRRLLPTAGQSHVAGPGIAQPLRAADQEQGVGTRGQDDGDRGPQQWIPSLVRHRPVEGEAIAKAGEMTAQWLWLWQPPPQHPPPGGGPSRLRSVCFPAVAGRAVSDMSCSSFRPSQ